MDVILHLNQHLATFVAQHGNWAYVFLFLIIFCETGLVVTPFLPGDSLLFAVGSICARGYLNIHVMVIVLICAALLGDNVNYFIGRTIGKTLFRNENSKIFKKHYLDRTHDFYEKYGAKTVIIARFLPIVRTFSPFAAGMAKMAYRTFLLFSFIGALLWVGVISYLSYLFGNIPMIRDHFSVVIIAIMVISLLPPVIEFLKIKLEKQSN